MIMKRNTKLQKIIIFCNCNLKLLLQLFARCSFSYVISDLLHDGGPYHIETSQSFCKKSRQLSSQKTPLYLFYRVLNTPLFSQIIMFNYYFHSPCSSSTTFTRDVFRTLSKMFDLLAKRVNGFQLFNSYPGDHPFITCRKSFENTNSTSLLRT